jgi:hypothetical protein
MGTFSSLWFSLLLFENIAPSLGPTIYRQRHLAPEGSQLATRNNKATGPWVGGKSIPEDPKLGCDVKF